MPQRPQVLHLPSSPGRETPHHHIIIRTLNVQRTQRLLKGAGKKEQVAHKGRPIRIRASFSMETERQKDWTGVL